MEEKRPQSLALPGNSIASYAKKTREEKKERIKMKPVVSKPATVRKKSWVQRTATRLLADDWEDIKMYIWSDTIIPAIKNLIYDMTVGSIEMGLYGTNNGRKSRNKNKSVVSYQGFYNKDKHERPSDVRRERISVDDLIFQSRGEAEDVLSALVDEIDEYGSVSVASLYDAANVSEYDFTANDFGWENLASARVDRVRDGYIIVLPKPRSLK